ncbi:MAG: hypothetical protein ACYTFY_13435 [Planctomycetota bacterium]|jgi:hypothetical protein
MDKEILEAQCFELFGKEVEVYEINTKHYIKPEEGKSEHSWKNHLLYVAEGRLKGCKESGAGGLLISELEDFISELLRLDEKDTLYSWQGRSSSFHYSGWANSKKNIYCTKSEK